MKKSTILFLTSTILSIVALVFAVYYSLLSAVPTLAIVVGVSLYTPLCLVQLGLLFRSLETKPEKEIIIKEVVPEPSKISSAVPETTTPSVVTDTIHEKWSKAMYDMFAEKWTEIFSNATYPADKATRAEISVELWKIASLTMDYLLVVNNDPNALKRNREITNAVVEGKDLINDVELKEFFQDPTSVQQKVLIINDMLSSQLAAKQSFDIPVFGYKVELGKK